MRVADRCVVWLKSLLRTPKLSPNVSYFWYYYSVFCYFVEFSFLWKCQGGLAVKSNWSSNHQRHTSLSYAEESTWLFTKVMPKIISAIRTIQTPLFSALNNTVSHLPHTCSFEPNPSWHVHGVVLGSVCKTIFYIDCSCKFWCLYVLCSKRIWHRRIFNLLLDIFVFYINISVFRLLWTRLVTRSLPHLCYWSKLLFIESTWYIILFWMI